MVRLASSPVITVAPIRFDNDVEYALDHDDGIVTDYLVRNRYERDRHTYLMPITSPDGFQGQSCAFVQLAAPTLLWIADWTAEKNGAVPEIPHPTPADPNWVLLDEHVEPNEILVGPDGQSPTYRISGTYVYGHRNPSAQIITNVAFARPPWIRQTTSIRRTLTMADLESGILDARPGANVGNTPVH